MLALDGSDDDDDSGMSGSIPAEPLQGTLSKWTNYIHGWQNRSVATGTVLASKSPIHCIQTRGFLNMYAHFATLDRCLGLSLMTKSRQNT